jgi:hypothetical protein
MPEGTGHLIFSVRYRLLAAAWGQLFSQNSQACYFPNPS